MNPLPAAKLFKEPAQWPLIPPWWLVPSTAAAALLNVKPATLISWRIRGYGPPPYPPMYLKPTQGRPLYYQYGELRSWAANALGMAYSFEDQCTDFFTEVLPVLNHGTGSLEGRIRTFERQYLDDRGRLLRGAGGNSIKAAHIHALDAFFERQPKRIGYAPLRL